MSRVLCEKSAKAALAASMTTLQMSVCRVQSFLTEGWWNIVGLIFFWLLSAPAKTFFVYMLTGRVWAGCNVVQGV